MSRYRCEQCGHVYDPAVGDERRDVPPDTSFDELVESWTCPTCHAGKDQFVAVDAEEA